MEKQFEALRAILITAYDNCPFYRQQLAEVFGGAPDNFSIEQFNSLPILTKDIIRTNYDNMINRKLKNSILTKSTGGSTGQPLTFAYTMDSYAWRVAMSLRGYSWAGAYPGCKQAYLWGVPLGAQPAMQRLKERIHQIIDRKLVINCFQFSRQQMRKSIMMLNKFKPKVVVGYTNALYALAQFMRENRLQLQSPPKSVISAAEKLFPYQRQAIEESFECKVYNTYGSREFMLIGAECEKREGLHISMENLYVEVVKDDGSPAGEGETGRIVITDLHNYGMPFIRYDTGDLGIATQKKCSCGRGLNLLLDVKGRVLDVIKTPSGKVVPGEFFPHLFKDFHDIYRFQVIQRQIDILEIKIVPAAKGKLSDDTLKTINTIIKETFGEDLSIRFEVVHEIPLTSSGKHRVTVSLL